jgi:hypothetical protein
MKNQPKRDMEGGFRLERIVKIKTWLFIAQLAIIVVFGVPSFLYFVLIMLLVIQIEGFVFVRLEARYLKSPSTRYYMTRNSMRRSYLVIVVALVFLLLFWAPVLNDAVQSASRSDKMYNVPATQPGAIAQPVTIHVLSNDIVGFTGLDKLSVMTTGQKALVFIVSEDNFNAFGSQGPDRLGSYRINQVIYEAYPGMEYSIPNLNYGKYVICIYSGSGQAMDAQVTYESHLSTHLVGYVPWFCIAFIIANIGWILYIRPICKMFEQRAIYR